MNLLLGDSTESIHHSAGFEPKVIAKESKSLFGRSGSKSYNKGIKVF